MVYPSLLEYCKLNMCFYEDGILVNFSSMHNFSNLFCNAIIVPEQDVPEHLLHLITW